MGCYLAIDIGASSGRHIVEKDGVQIEVYRFSTGFAEQDGHLVCDIERLTENVIAGIEIANKRFEGITSLAIDTWGVDYVLLSGDETVYPVYSYRDTRTAKAVEEVHALIPFERLYSRTGIQMQPFNTVYQLYADKLAGRLDSVTDFLMLPEYLNYRLTGVKMKEYTNATTTGLVNAVSKKFDREITEILGLPAVLFPALHNAGETVGDLIPEMRQKVGGNVRVKLCLSHDTASAVYGIPFERRAPYISSGTWSLLGITQENAHTDPGSMRANYSNEGGIDRSFRYQKNIIGMWAVNQTAADLGLKSAVELEAAAAGSDYRETVDLNSPEFMIPGDYVGKIKRALDEKGKSAPRSAGDIAACIHHSLAYLYKVAVEELEENTGENFDELYIVGGGARNKHLNKLTEEYTGKKIIALPIEATALGNLRIQRLSDE